LELVVLHKKRERKMMKIKATVEMKWLVKEINDLSKKV